MNSSRGSPASANRGVRELLKGESVFLLLVYAGGCENQRTGETGRKAFVPITMSLPKLIDPCPIQEVTAAVLFDSVVPPEAILGVVYQAVGKEFGTVEALPFGLMPNNVRDADPNLRIQPTHKLSSKEYSVFLGPHVVAVTKSGTYPGWNTFFPTAMKTLNAIGETHIIGGVNRFDLRYVTFFDGDVLSRLTLDISIAGEPAVGKQTALKTLISGTTCSSLLHIANGAALRGDMKKLGTVIDIDSFQEVSSLFAADGLAHFLNGAHVAEKTLFFKLLKEDFLKTLNPRY